MFFPAKTGTMSFFLSTFFNLHFLCIFFFSTSSSRVPNRDELSRDCCESVAESLWAVRGFESECEYRVKNCYKVLVEWWEWLNVRFVELRIYDCEILEIYKVTLLKGAVSAYIHFQSVKSTTSVSSRCEKVVRKHHTISYGCVRSWFWRTIWFSKICRIELLAGSATQILEHVQN